MTKEPKIKMTETEALDLQQMIGSARRRLLNVEETALYLNISPKTIYNQTGDKSKKRFPVPFKKFGRRVLFDIRDLQKFVSKL